MTLTHSSEAIGRFVNSVHNSRNVLPNKQTFALIVAILFGITLAMQPVEAQTLTVLHAFKGGTDGTSPYAGLIRGSTGNLYGTTSGAGLGGGTVFKVAPNGKETVLYSFKLKPDGANPFADLVRDAAGNLYGTTKFGGTGKCVYSVGDCGTLFKVTTTGEEIILHSFNYRGGRFPLGRIVRDAAGNFYGTTGDGGSQRGGTLYKLSPTGAYTVVHSFNAAKGDSLAPNGLVQDTAGNFYGTSFQGGKFRFGTVFKVTATGTETVLHSFGSGTDGYFPAAGLILDSAGNLYGTTRSGGSGNLGTVFMLTPSGAETVLPSFTGQPDGAAPQGELVMDSKGNLYGTTFTGGTANAGTVFKVDPAGNESVLYSFTGGTDGGNPSGGLVLDAKGNLLGTTVQGGLGNGVVFKLH